MASGSTPHSCVSFQIGTLQHDLVFAISGIKVLHYIYASLHLVQGGVQHCAVGVRYAGRNHLSPDFLEAVVGVEDAQLPNLLFKGDQSSFHLGDSVVAVVQVTHLLGKCLVCLHDGEIRV